jgi:hypothetical protein
LFHWFFVSYFSLHFINVYLWLYYDFYPSTNFCVVFSCFSKRLGCIVHYSFEIWLFSVGAHSYKLSFYHYLCCGPKGFCKLCFHFYLILKNILILSLISLMTHWWTHGSIFVKLFVFTYFLFFCFWVLFIVVWWNIGNYFYLLVYAQPCFML